MNVAVILTGQFREYQEVFDNFDKYILQPLQPDVFIHTWDNLGLNTDRYQYDTETPLDVVDVLEKYHPVSICVEDHKKVQICSRAFKATNHNVPIDNIMNMIRKTWLGGKLLRANEKHYDLVLKLRPDIKFEGHMPIDEMEVDAKPWLFNDFLYVPDVSNLQVCDHFAFSTMYGTDMYTRLYEFLGKYYNPELITPNKNPTGSPFHAESLLYKHLVNRDNELKKFWNPQVKVSKWKYHIPHKRRGL